jgi:hypothetical protein
MDLPDDDRLFEIMCEAIATGTFPGWWLEAHLASIDVPPERAQPLALRVWDVVGREALRVGRIPGTRNKPRDPLAPPRKKRKDRGAYRGGLRGEGRKTYLRARARLVRGTATVEDQLFLEKHARRAFVDDSVDPRLEIAVDNGEGMGYTSSSQDETMEQPVTSVGENGIDVVCFDEGYAAYGRGEEIIENPYNTLSFEATMWREGWRSARNEARDK